MHLREERAPPPAHGRARRWAELPSLRSTSRRRAAAVPGENPRDRAEKSHRSRDRAAVPSPFQLAM